MKKARGRIQCAQKTALAVVLVLLMGLTGCTKGSYIAVRSYENNTPVSMSMRYEKFSGKKSKTISLDTPSEVFVAVITESGSLNLSITDAEGNSFYTGKDLPSSSFSVSLGKPGKYTIKVEAKDHKGSYDISWDTANEAEKAPFT
jgi:hypothetical protein